LAGGLAVLALLAAQPGEASMRRPPRMPPPRGGYRHVADRARRAGGRDSYADIVEIVSPAVGDDSRRGQGQGAADRVRAPDDFLRQFFGDRSERGSREPRAPQKQHASAPAFS